jgi:predicted metalloprotease with PDZ domain
VVSHEYFHAWNVKQLRPAEIVPGSWEVEPLTPSLGISEGFTTYYAALGVERARLIPARALLDQLTRWITEVQTAPGHQVQSLAQSSFDTWIKFYRPDEDSGNTAISYYTKGAIAGWLLDVEIRRKTRGARSLDDVMVEALRRNPREKGFTITEFRHAAEAVAGTDLSGWFRRTFDSTEELDFQPALDWFGLRFRGEAGGRYPSLGARVKIEAGRVVVTEVPRGSSAFEAGINAGDEIVAINDARVKADQWETALRNHRPGEQVRVLVARRDRLIAIDAKLGAPAWNGWNVEMLEHPTPEQQAHLKSWFLGSSN